MIAHIAHIAHFKRSEGHLGGVPKFGAHLKRAIPDLVEFSWADFPEAQAQGRLPEQEKALRLSAWLWESGRLREAKAIVVDGFWGRGLPDSAPAVVVCHGTYRGMAFRMHTSGAAELARAQQPEYQRFPVVAVSEWAAWELQDLCDVMPAKTIYNGVDLDEFHPREGPPGSPPVAIYTNRHPLKGGDVVDKLAARGLAVDFQYLNAKAGEEAEKFRRGDLFLYPSRNDGNAYALLEALATGLPVVGAAVGLLGEGVTPRPGIVLPIPPLDGRVDLESWERALSEAVARRGEFQPRECAERWGDYRRFADEWRTFLGA